MKRLIIPILLLILALMLSSCDLFPPSAEQPIATEEIPEVETPDVEPEEPEATEEAPEPTPELVPTETIPLPPTATTAPDSGDGPIPTPIMVDPATLLGEPDAYDDFSSAKDFADTTTDCFRSEIGDGKMFMNAIGAEGSFCWQISSFQPMQNTYMEVVGENLACEGGNRFGLFLRAPDNNRGYMYGVTCDGKYVMSVWDGAKSTVLVEPTLDQAILAGQGAINRIGILANGAGFDLYVNGIYLTRVEDATFNQPGKMGFFVHNFSPQGFIVTYDDLKIWLLDGEVEQLQSSEQTSIGAPIPVEGDPMVVANTNVNVRSGPGTEYPVIGALLAGEAAKVAGVSPDGAWWAGEIPPGYTPDNLGWVSGAYVTASNTDDVPVIQPPDPPVHITPLPPEGEGSTFVTTETINVREGPGNEFDSLGKLPQGTTVHITSYSEDGRWASINLPGGGTGWINTGYLTPVGGGS